MKLLLLYLLIVIAASCKSQSLNVPLKITPLTVMNEIDTLVDRNRTSVNLIENFLVDGCISDTNKLYREIDNFVEKNKNKRLAMFSVYYMEFFKASARISVEAVNKNPDLITKSLLIADPRIVTYLWYNGKFGGKIMNRLTYK
jgi:hypothetical protein